MIATLTDWMNWRTLATGAVYGGQDLSPVAPAARLEPVDRGAGIPADATAGRGRLAAGPSARRVDRARRNARRVVRRRAAQRRQRPAVVPRHARAHRGDPGRRAARRALDAARSGRPSARGSTWLAVPALAFMAWAALHATTADSWLPRGGLLLHAAATSVVIAAASSGVWRRVLGLAAARRARPRLVRRVPVPLADLPVDHAGTAPDGTGGRRRRCGWRSRWRSRSRPTSCSSATWSRCAVANGAPWRSAPWAWRWRWGSPSIAAPVASADERVTIESGLVAPPNTAATPATTATHHARPPRHHDRCAGCRARHGRRHPPRPADGGSPRRRPSPDGATSWARLTAPGPLGRPPVILVVGDSAAGTLGFGLQRVSTLTGQCSRLRRDRAGLPGRRPGRAALERRRRVHARRTRARHGVTSGGDVVEFVQPDLVVSLVSIWEIVDRRLDRRW